MREFGKYLAKNIPFIFSFVQIEYLETKSMFYATLVALKDQNIEAKIIQSCCDMWVGNKISIFTNA